MTRPTVLEWAGSNVKGGRYSCNTPAVDKDCERLTPSVLQSRQRRQNWEIPVRVVMP
jgi:hypothetical protein